jgi:hypothetical protein
MSHLCGLGVQTCWNMLHPGVDVRDALRGGVETIKSCVKPMMLVLEREEGLTRGERRERRDVWIHAAGV